MSAAPTTEMSFRFTTATKDRIEAEAKRLNLTTAAYMLYLMQRAGLSVAEAASLDRDVNEIFGKNGDLMRRLAK